MAVHPMEDLHWVWDCLVCTPCTFLLGHCYRPSANDYELQSTFLGFDRLMAVLCQATSLRDVIAFPKSYLGRDLLTGAPSEVEPSELASYHIQVLNSSSV